MEATFNHLILIYKFYIYNSGNRAHLNIVHLKAISDKTKIIEEKSTKHEPKKRPKYLKNDTLSLRTLFKW